MSDGDGGGVSRRDFFKLSAVAVAAGASVLREPTPAAAQTQCNPEFLCAEFGFKVEIDGAPISSASVRRVDIEPLEFKTKKRKPGKPIIPRAVVTVDAGPEQDAELRSWFDTARNGTCERRDITIDVLDAGGAPARSYDFYDCFPLTWSFDSIDKSTPDSTGEVLKYTFTIVPDRMELKAG